MSKINPRVQTVEIGIREIEELTVYPLSIADQFNMSELITKALQKFFSAQNNKNSEKALEGESAELPLPEEMKDIEFISFLVDLVQENLVKVLMLSTDHTTEAKASKLLTKITNDQAVEFATKIYEMNYEIIAKNGKSLFEKIAGVIQSGMPRQSLKRPSQALSSDIPDMDSNISSDSASETAD